MLLPRSTSATAHVAMGTPATRLEIMANTRTSRHGDVAWQPHPLPPAGCRADSGDQEDEPDGHLVDRGDRRVKVEGVRLAEEHEQRGPQERLRRPPHVGQRQDDGDAAGREVPKRARKVAQRNRPGDDNGRRQEKCEPHREPTRGRLGQDAGHLGREGFPDVPPGCGGAWRTPQRASESAGGAHARAMILSRTPAGPASEPGRGATTFTPPPRPRRGAERPRRAARDEAPGPRARQARPATGDRRSRARRRRPRRPRSPRQASRTSGVTLPMASLVARMAATMSAVAIAGPRTWARNAPIATPPYRRIQNRLSGSST